MSMWVGVNAIKSIPGVPNEILLLKDWYDELIGDFEYLENIGDYPKLNYMRGNYYRLDGESEEDFYDRSLVLHQSRKNDLEKKVDLMNYHRLYELQVDIKEILFVKRDQEFEKQVRTHFFPDVIDIDSFSMILSKSELLDRINDDNFEKGYLKNDIIFRDIDRLDDSWFYHIFISY